MTDKPYRIQITGGRLHGQAVTVMASDEWAAMAAFMNTIDKALNDDGVLYTWPVFVAPGTGDLFGDAVEVPTITLQEALEALAAHG